MVVSGPPLAAREHGLGHQAHEGLELSASARRRAREEAAKIAPGEGDGRGRASRARRARALASSPSRRSPGNQGEHEERRPGASRPAARPASLRASHAERIHHDAQPQLVGGLDVAFRSRRSRTSHPLSRYGTA